MRIADKRIKRNDHSQRRTKPGLNIDGNLHVYTHTQIHMDRVELRFHICDTLSYLIRPNFQPSRVDLMLFKNIVLIFNVQIFQPSRVDLILFIF